MSNHRISQGKGGVAMPVLPTVDISATNTWELERISSTHNDED